MEKLSKSLEILKLLSPTISETSVAINEKSRSDPASIAKERIHHLNNIVDLLCSPSLIKANNETYFKFLTASVETLFIHCDENDYDVRIAAEENINKLIKTLKEINLPRIQVELHRIIKRNPNIGQRALKGALWRFAELFNVIHPKKIRPFFEHLLHSFCSIAARPEEIVHEKLPDYYELIFRVLGRSINDKEIKELFSAYLANMSHESAVIRRSSAACLAIISRYSRYPMGVTRYLITISIDKLLEHYDQVDSTRLIIGYLGLIKNLVQSLGVNIEEFQSLSINIQQTINTNRNHDSSEQHIPISVRQIIECVDMICYLCLQHNDHNVVSSSLETLEIILKYANLFDFDQLLISTENTYVEETRVSQKLKTVHAEYHRSFSELNEQQEILTNKISDEFDGTSLNNNEKRTSAAKLVEQLISKYILNKDGTMKSDDESRVSVKCATITCLSYLSTIDPLAFFYSFDYPAEIITYLLSLREHGDPQLRGACANLLAKLTQTTVHLLTISPPISSLSSSFINQCSLVSTDSQESSRLDMQLGILAELLSTFRLCLNDKNSRVIHASLNALRTLLPVLLLNSHPLTIIGIELLNDAIQHSSNSYILAKIALAQLIGDIDFRILTYLEQQQQIKETNRSWLDRCIEIIFQFLTEDDVRLRQVAASTYAKLVDRSSFLPCQWPIHCLLKWINSSSQWIYKIHHSLQPSNTLTIVSDDDVQCETVSCLSTLIFDRLAQATTRIQIVGCLEGIYALVKVLTPTTIRSFFHNQYDEIRLLIHFFKHPFILHDLNNLQLLLDILNVIFINLSNNANDIGDLQSTEKVFHFLIKILSIFTCTIEDTTPPAPASSKINFPQLPASPQQLKKRFESSPDSKNEKDLSTNDATSSMTTSKDSPTSSNNDKDKKSNRTPLGAVGNNPSMMKLFDLIRASYQTHKSLLSSLEVDRFGQLLSTTLTCITSVLSLISIQDLSKHIEEALNYLKSTFNVDKIKTMHCTQEFLLNLHQLTVHSPLPTDTKPSNNTTSQIPINNTLTNIHTITIRQPMIYLFGSKHTTNVHGDQSTENSIIRDLYLTKKQQKTIDHLKRPPNRTERSKIGHYIRLFEPIVILSLKKYVNTNETDFQAAVLDLLVELLLIRVNYSLLDADEHFLTHITNQLELIEEESSCYNVPSYFIYRIAEFLVKLSHDTLHSKQVIKIQDLIKHCDSLLASGHEPETHALSALEPVVYDLFLVRLKADNKELEAQRMVIVQALLKLVRYNKALQLLIVIVDSVRNEVDKWKRLSRQIVDVLLVHLQSSISIGSLKGQSLLDIYSTQLTLFDVVSSVALRPIDPFVGAFRSLANRNDVNHQTMNRWLVSINVILRCLVQNSTEDAILTRWNDASSIVSGIREETFSAALLRILLDVIARLITNARQCRGQIDMILVVLVSDYLYLIIHIIDNVKHYRTIVNDFRKLLIHDETDETVHRLDSFSYLNNLSEHFKLLSYYYVPLLLQWTHILNILDYTQEAWWSSMLSIPTPSSLITHLSISGQLQSYCDLICRHDLYVEHLTSIITHHQLLFLLFEQSDTCTYVHNLFGLIHSTSVASHLFVESIYTNWDNLLKRNRLLLSLKILRALEGIHLDENGLLLVLLIEQFLTLPYITVLRLAELIVCRRIERMLTFDEETLNKQLLPKYLPLILQALSSSNNDQNNKKHDIKSNEHLWGLIQRLIKQMNYTSNISIDIVTQDFKNLNCNEEDFIITWIKKVNCPMDITPKIYAQMLKTVTYKKLLPFMMSPDFVWLSMPHCLILGLQIPSLWRASTSALIKKINDLCFSLPTQRLIPNEINLHDDESTPDSIYIKSLISCSTNQPYLIALIDSISTYFDTIQTNPDLAVQFSSGDIRDLLRFIIFIGEIIYINISRKKSFLSWNSIESFFRCLTKTIHNPTSIIYQLLSATNQIVSCCTLVKTVVVIFEYLFQRNGLIIKHKQKDQSFQSYLNLIEPDTRPFTHLLLVSFNDVDRLYDLTKEIKSIPIFFRRDLRRVAILLFRLPIFNSFIRVPKQFWEQNQHDIKLQFGLNDYCLSSFPADLLQHSEIMADYTERISLVGWLSRTQFQEIWVSFLASMNATNQQNDDNQQTTNQLTKEEILESNATQCVWIRGVTTFLLNALRLNCTGNPADMTFEHRCRNKSIPFLLTEIGGQYIQTRSTLEANSNNLFTNIERLGSQDLLSYGQLSFDTILTSIQSNTTLPLPVNSLFDRLFSRQGLDLTSSLQILIELYTRWLTINPNNLCLQLKYELIRSFIYLSDLFTSSQQLTNLYDLCEKYLNSWFDEDDLMISLISYGLCKSGVLLGQINKESNELYIRLIERNFKLATKTYAYSSCLFLLESHEDDINKLLMPILIQELNSDIQTNNNLKINLDIRLNGYILANLFYLIENNSTNNIYDILTVLFKDDTIDINDNLTQKMISTSLERLLILGQYPKNDIWRLYKRSITSLRQSSWLNTDHLVLILTRIYTLLQRTNENTNITNNDHSNEEQEMIEGSSIILSSDNIVIELFGELYERTKQSSTLPHEAILLLRPLPSLLAHIGLSDRLMNKMVLEFAASAQQLYPQILAYTVYGVFRALLNAHYSSKVNEWTLLSMTSIAQRKPIRLAIWGLTCLMLSACPSHNIADALFPLTLSRFSARFEDLDNRLFLLAGREYYTQLKNVEQRRQFEQAFANESNTEKLYADLLAYIQDVIISSS